MNLAGEERLVMRLSCASRVVGPLAQYAEGFQVEVARLGYPPRSAADQLRLMAHLSRWLARRHLDATAVGSPVVEEFFAERRVAGYVDHVSVRALTQLRSYLRSVGVSQVVAPVSPSPLDALLGRYRDYLTAERGLRADTAGRYVDLVRPFLAGRVSNEDNDGLGRLTPGEVTAFVVSHCRQPRRGSAKLMVTALRSVLRFLHINGVVAQPLAAAVPSVAGWKQASLPRGVQPDQVTALLASCDRSTAVGLRDLAILTVLTRLGLRVSEVVALSLDDIDWRRGEITVRGKGDRRERLPLPADVGQVIVDYLAAGRRRASRSRAVFVGAKAPYQSLTPTAVTQVVLRAARRAGLPPVTGHRLRHTAASDMLRGGASLGEIGQVLRHRDMLTTAIYAKVDSNALRLVARSWPGAAA